MQAALSSCIAYRMRATKCEFLQISTCRLATTVMETTPQDGQGLGGVGWPKNQGMDESSKEVNMQASIACTQHPCPGKMMRGEGQSSVPSGSGWQGPPSRIILTSSNGDRVLPSRLAGLLVPPIWIARGRIRSLHPVRRRHAET